MFDLLSMHMKKYLLEDINSLNRFIEELVIYFWSMNTLIPKKKAIIIIIKLLEILINECWFMNTWHLTIQFTLHFFFYFSFFITLQHWLYHLFFYLRISFLVRPNEVIYESFSLIEILVSLPHSCWAKLRHTCIANLWRKFISNYRWSTLNSYIEYPH